MMTTDTALRRLHLQLDCAITAQRKRDYPLACAGINVTSMLLELLRMRDPRESEEAVQSRPPFGTEWDCDMFHFYCHMFYR